MIAEGEFNYFLDGESKTIDEIRKLADVEMTVSVKGLDVHYFSPKKSKKRPSEEFKDVFGVDFSPLKGKIQEILKEADQHQAKNGGILRGVEFPFDTTESYLDRSRKTIEDWNRKEFYITQPSKENLYKMCESFEQRVKNDSDKCGILNKGIPECHSKIGQKHNEGKLPLDIMLTVQFPKAIQAVCKATLFGHEKYKDTDLDWLNYKRVRGGSTTYANACQRHNFNKSGRDDQSGLPHIVHKCWNALAELELWIEENKYE